MIYDIWKLEFFYPPIFCTCTCRSLIYDHLQIKTISFFHMYFIKSTIYTIDALASISIIALVTCTMITHTHTHTHKMNLDDNICKCLHKRMTWKYYIIHQTMHRFQMKISLLNSTSEAKELRSRSKRIPYLLLILIHLEGKFC